MAEKSAPISLGYGTSAWSEYEAAQQEARDILAQRNNQLFDPMALAAAQGFLAPTKTGGFGESLGNVAGAVGQAQTAEEKRAMEMAKMRMELAQQSLQTEVQGQAAKEEQEYWNRKRGVPTPAPAAQAPASAPAPAPAPAPQAAPAGGLPTVATGAPVAAPLSAPAAPQAPQMPAPATGLPTPQATTAQMPVGQQLFPPEPETWTPQEELMARSMRAAGKKGFEIDEAIDKQRRENKVVRENQATDLRTGKIYTPVDPTPTEVRIPGKGVYVTNKTMASRLAGAQAENDPEKYWTIADQITQGMTRPAKPAPANATPTGAPPAGAPAQSGMKTKAQEEAEAAQAKAEAEKAGTGRGARTSTAMDKVEPAIEVRAVAQSTKDLVNQEGAELVMGIFEKPTVRSALAKMVDEGKFTPVGFRDAMVAANVAFSVPQKPDESGAEYKQRKQDILDRYYQIGTQVARAKFEASTLAKGQGAFSDGERRMFADTTISTKQSVNTINKTADMLLARANFAENLANAIEDSNLSYDRFRRTPEYQKMLKSYENELRLIWGGKTASTKGKPDLNAAREAVEKELR